MARCRYSLMFLNACGVLLCLVADFRPLVITGFFKLVAFLVLACLIAFVAVRSANVCRLLIAYLRGSVGFFGLAVESSIGRAITENHRCFHEPSLRPLFQRPPPVLSL